MTSLDKAIKQQRRILSGLLKDPLKQLTIELSKLLVNRELLEEKLHAMCLLLKHSKYIYVLDAKRIQLTANISRSDKDDLQFGRDRSYRPYMQHDFKCSDFHLSDAYISKN
ncbi:MAG: hypothetical protein QM504_15945, partial [Pseudomonadota bacterium]